MKRGGFQFALDMDVVSDHVSSYQFLGEDRGLQFRAFRFANGRIFLNGSDRELGSLTAADIDFSVASKVGSGNSGIVSYAETFEHRMPLAIKYIPLNSKEHRDEIDRELRVFFSRHDSIHIVRCYGAFWKDDEDTICIPMEWMDLSLQQMAIFSRGIQESVLRAVAFQAVQALRYIHDVKRVIHRDVKPSNILVNADGVVKLGDFGVAKVCTTFDVPTTYVGTMLFMAPERLDESPRYDARSDIWSLGVTLVACAVARNPWAPPEEMKLFQLISRMAAGTVPELPAEEFSADARDFVKQCLTRDLADRPESSALARHPWIAGMTEEEAQAEVRTFVKFLMPLVVQWAKQSAEVTKSPEQMVEDATSSLDDAIGGF